MPTFNSFLAITFNMGLSRDIIERNIVLPDIPDHPHHPATTFIYPKREFGKKNIVSSLFSHHGLRSGLGFTTAKMLMLCFVIFAF